MFWDLDLCRTNLFKRLGYTQSDRKRDVGLKKGKSTQRWGLSLGSVLNELDARMNFVHHFSREESTPEQDWERPPALPGGVSSHGLNHRLAQHRFLEKRTQPNGWKSCCHSIVANTVPGGTSEPPCTTILDRTPVAGASMSMVTFADIISSRGSPFCILSPSFLYHFVTVPVSMV